MKAAIVEKYGSPPVYGDFAEPAPEHGEVIVRVTAAALSHVTRSRAEGRHYSSASRFPFVPGIDGVGLLENGRRVYFAFPPPPLGSMAERVAIPAARCIPLPDGLGDIAAAALANPAMSSWAALVERACLKSGETVIVNGATGAAGGLAVRIARHLGAGKVIATGRDAEKLATLGADATIRLGGDEDALEKAMRSHFSDGVDVVLDYLWGRSAERLLLAGAKAGPDAVPIRFVQIGSASGDEICLPSGVLRASAIAVMGSGIGSIPLERLAAAIEGVLGVAIPAGLEIATRPVPLADVARAWADPDDGKRIVFVP